MRSLAPSLVLTPFHPTPDPHFQHPLGPPFELSICVRASPGLVSFLATLCREAKTRIKGALNHILRASKVL